MVEYQSGWVADLVQQFDEPDGGKVKEREVGREGVGREEGGRINLRYHIDSTPIFLWFSCTWPLLNLHLPLPLMAVPVWSTLHIDE